jgi:hypothetical protein
VTIILIRCDTEHKILYNKAVILLPVNNTVQQSRTFFTSKLNFAPLGKPRRRWKDNIRLDVREEGCGGMDWIGLAQDRDRWRAIVNAVMNPRVQ